MPVKNGVNDKSLIFLIVIFFIIIVSAVVVVISLQTNPVEEMIKNEEPIKILFVLKDDNSVLFTNVFVYYPVLSRGALFDIPGNTGAIFSSIDRVDRIDSVFKEKGVDAYRYEIQKLLGQPIPFNIVMNVKDFQLITDMLGGLRVFIPYPIDIQTEDMQRWLLPSGMVNLDGDKISTYLYYSSPEETAVVVRDRYQSVMTAFLSALNRNYPSMFEKRNFKYFESFFDSNLDKDDLRIMLENVSQVDSERLVFRTVSGSPNVIDGQTLLLPMYDGEIVQDLFKRTLASLATASDTMYDRTYVLEVQNGTTVQGLARNTSIFFQGLGYDVIGSVNADSNDYEKTIIVNHIGNDEIAKTLGDLIMCDNIVTEDILPESAGMDIESRVDFTIILGKDFDGRYVRKR